VDQWQPQQLHLALQQDPPNSCLLSAQLGSPREMKPSVLVYSVKQPSPQQQPLDVQWWEQRQGALGGSSCGMNSSEGPGSTCSRSDSEPDTFGA
jgi:hypothetical protein